MATDEELLRAFQQGDEQAFSQLYQRHRMAIYRFLARRLSSSVRAEELCQDVFVALVEHAGSWRGEASVKTYLYRIAFNRLVSDTRRSEHRVMVAPAPDDEPAPAREPQAAERPDVVFETQERARLVREALERLSPEFRDTLVLKEYDGLSCEEIAEVLGVAVGTVKSRLFRAKLELKRHLAAFFASPSSPAD
ncbi:RNA polymerase sigma factor [Chloracidobacterium aggregatum]|jgi:RNA polymerase sigma-70 factor (ECF subfamily)|uniref:Sigma-70 family RNA polymerase sigma factor n=1 Tax=Chloracidobacterium sp. N TaxID=2821540 RepID=A0ABX8AZK5_9BACT|nr:sigma-70 family RNA polymerase sigma factor [Chloracidobacterium aggregatum]QUV84350.1 sigma-70 family RNA polymerase sigma factor [Chloracidobacterium sp. 2]QUV87165.1 sigma-70 family RNA polymerase sigma factor [Chloracidobacterium sp. S]QUV90066.1 sigma-70 family RNA polymerase sigma factor [Chloracidobacterium sp. A]QUV93277.1 sigma-70 family RNA polymerase sigma factor [Chloracidobacterium sp. N]QUV96435.1 sigma-70 family RNA polymerase sigma factor [Chloracidobacterium sp. E]